MVEAFFTMFFAGLGFWLAWALLPVLLFLAVVFLVLLIAACVAIPMMLCELAEDLTRAVRRWLWLRRQR
jgi:hypothetical protein